MSTTRGNVSIFGIPLDQLPGTHNKSSDLKKMFQAVEWTSIKEGAGTRSTELSKDSIFFSVAETAKDLKMREQSGRPKKYGRKVVIAIGKKLVDVMGWNEGDKINILYDKKDHGNFMLVKLDNSHGRKLTIEKKANVARTSFTWQEASQLPIVSSLKVDFEIDSNKIYFRVNHAD